MNVIMTDLTILTVELDEDAGSVARRMHVDLCRRQMRDVREVLHCQITSGDQRVPAVVPNVDAPALPRMDAAALHDIARAVQRHVMLPLVPVDTVKVEAVEPDVVAGDGDPMADPRAAHGDGAGGAQPHPVGRADHDRVLRGAVGGDGERAAAVDAVGQHDVVAGAGTGDGAAQLRVVGDLEQPGAGILAVLPVSQVRGLRKRKPGEG